MPNWADIVVAGSCMIDLISYAPRLPKGGETLRGTRFQSGFGGKGGNQCVAARKLGADCVMIGRVGSDFFGRSYYEKLNEYKISTKFLKVTDGVSTGIAQITVAETGENTIVIVPGANDRVTEQDIEKASDNILRCKVLLCQLEIPDNSTIKALEIKAKSKTGKSILNAAPATSKLNPLLFSLPDIFCVNQTEAEIITGVKVSSQEEAKAAAGILQTKGCKEVIITLGELGSLYKKQSSSECIICPAVPVTAVDTAGAGDSFIGALAYFLSLKPHMPMKSLLEKANAAASVSVQRLGTQESFPGVFDLPEQV